MLRDGHFATSIAVAPECKPRISSDVQMDVEVSPRAEGRVGSNGLTDIWDASTLRLMVTAE